MFGLPRGQGCHDTAKAYCDILQYMTTVLQDILQYIAMGYYYWKKPQTNTEIPPHVESFPPICKLSIPWCGQGGTKMVYKSLWKRSNSEDIGILINVLWHTNRRLENILTQYTGM
jgi:hypothetical protein